MNAPPAPTVKLEPTGQGAGGGRYHRAGFDVRATRVVVAPRKDQLAAAGHDHVAAAADGPGKRRAVGVIEGQHGIVQHGAGKRTGGPAADLERAGGDYRAARIGVAAGEREDSRPGLRQASGPADRAGKGLGAKD